MIGPDLSSVDRSAAMSGTRQLDDAGSLQLRSGQMADQSNIMMQIVENEIDIFIQCAPGHRTGKHSWVLHRRGKACSTTKEMVDGRDGEASVENSLLSQSNNGGTTCIEPKHKNRTSLQNCLSHKGKRSKLIAAFIVILLITIVIIISVVVCCANNDDEDENFDRTTFNLQQKFNGSFQMEIPFSNETQGLNDVQGKLTKLYESSHALGRFFSNAETFHLGSESAVVQYKLTFIFPEEELRNSTLSTEIVYNVFRQFLYDQNEEESGTMFILPSSLKMHTMH